MGGSRKTENMAAISAVAEVVNVWVDLGKSENMAATNVLQMITTANQ